MLSIKRKAGDFRKRNDIRKSPDKTIEGGFFIMKETQTNRTYKSRIFEMIFSDPKELLGLYNAVNGTQYQDPSLLEINTLENAIYMAMHNDISFLVDLRLNLYEHQLPTGCGGKKSAWS